MKVRFVLTSSNNLTNATKSLTPDFVILIQEEHNRDEEIEKCLYESEPRASLRKITDCLLINIFTPAIRVQILHTDFNFATI